MIGENCIGIASDKRLNVGFQTITNNFQKVYRMQDNILLGLSGLATDCITFYKKLRYKLNMYRIREGIDMTANTFAHLVGTTLYSHRQFPFVLTCRFSPFFCHPVVAGLDDGKPILYEYDAIGTQSNSETFAMGGTAMENMYGLFESYYKPGMKPQQVEDTLSEILLAGIERDIGSGYGGVVYVLTPNDLKIVHLKTNML